MKVLVYAGSEFLTGDDLAIGLMRYGVALAVEHTASSVEIPIIEPDGSRASALFLLGPASQIVAKSVTTDFPELVDDDVAHELDRLRSGLSLSPDGSTQPPDDADENWWANGI